MRVELRDEARDDLADGAWFYGRQSPGLGDYFIELYRKLSKRFPFAIYYVLTDEIIEVVAILDCRSDPNSTDARLRRTMR